MRRITAKGFTLVELLIVIALLGVIATIVIAAINPIEQANRASDSGMKADASNLVSALQRYYTGQNAYPWNSSAGTYKTPGAAYPWTDAAALDAAEGPGLCGTSCTNGGKLIEANELQIAFLSRKFITAGKSLDKIFIGKGPGASSSVFACWVPKSNSARQAAIANLKVISLATDIGSTGLPAAGACTDVKDAAWDTDAAKPTCAECVPE